MTPDQYQAALHTLNLRPSDVCAWLGVSERTERNWRKMGPTSAASVAIGMAVAIETSRKRDVDTLMGYDDYILDRSGHWLEYPDLAPLLAVREGES